MTCQIYSSVLPISMHLMSKRPNSVCPVLSKTITFQHCKAKLCFWFSAPTQETSDKCLRALNLSSFARPTAGTVGTGSLVGKSTQSDLQITAGILFVKAVSHEEPSHGNWSRSLFAPSSLAHESMNSVDRPFMATSETNRVKNITTHPISRVQRLRLHPPTQPWFEACEVDIKWMNNRKFSAHRKQNSCEKNTFVKKQAATKRQRVVETKLKQQLKQLFSCFENVKRQQKKLDSSKFFFFLEPFFNDKVSSPSVKWHFFLW